MEQNKTAASEEKEKTDGKPEVRMCSSCHYMNEHCHCEKYNRRVPPVMQHPADRRCPYFEDFFDRADREFVIQNIELMAQYSKHYAKEELLPLEPKEPVKPKKKVRTVKDVWG